MSLIEARGLARSYRNTVALAGIDLTVEPGRIVGLIGPNGAGKSTALQAIMGLTSYQGSLSVLGRDPWTHRAELTREISFIADVAVLPRWIRVNQVMDFMAGVHPHFDRTKAAGFLGRTTIKPTSRVRELSKGMVTQLHLALVMAIDAKLLVLDEPTLGLDVLYRKQFYDSLLNDFYDKTRTIIVSTHQVDEIEEILTDVVFLDRGRIVLSATMETVAERFQGLSVKPEQAASARSLGPIHERRLFDRSQFIFDGVAPERLAGLGEIRAPDLSDIFVAVMGGPPVEVAA